MSSISAGLSDGTALVSTGDTTGELVLKTNGGTTAVTIGTDQSVTFAAGVVTTSPTVLPAGTASAPALTTTGDTNTGLFFPAADTIAFAEGGAEAMRIDSSGRVGIGTSSPSSFNSAARNLVVGSGSGAQGMTIYAGTADSSNIFFADGTSSSAPYIGQIRYFHDNNYMMFVTNDGERMRIDSGGNLLNGTTVAAGVVANGGTVVSGGFRTISGSLTNLGSGTAYTMFTLTADFATWLVNVHGLVSSTTYSETAIVQLNNTSVRVDIISAGGGVVISNSGLDIQVAQTSGVTMNDLLWSAIRIR